ARFIDGLYRVEPADSGPVDGTISADPVAFLLVGSGRLNPVAAVALGLLSTGGEHPELALGFNQLFVYP
ncbi:MAG: maleylpyruvate isomerase family mycothiol-dependent enzyme, partial [Acidimicrobiia bacterium]